MKPSEIFSHPDRYLEDHLGSVIEIGLEFYKKVFNDETLKDVFTIIAFSHDIGKSTKFFQDYLKGQKRFDISKKKNHSLLGAVISLYLTDRYLKSKGIENPFLLALSFIIPKRHHSNLRDFLDEFTLESDDIGILKEQIESIDREKFNQFFSNLNFQNKDILKFSFDELDIEKVKKNLLKIKSYIRKLKDNLDYFIDTITLFSLLLDADKSDVGIKTDKNKIFEEVDISPCIVDKYIEKLQQNHADINNIRMQAYKEISQKDIDLNQKIYTITLPTGTGKTLITLKTALRIAKKVKQEKGKDLKIIYCLPFLSVIEQNHSVFEEVLQNPDNSILLKYHHLTGFNYKLDDELDYDTSRILIEGFNSKIIITTFMQFFYSIISNQNKMLRKFHKFTNSVVILDEVQTIPHKYWLLVREILYKMAQRFDFYVILSTATQPMIFDNKNSIELADYEKYFSAFDRYEIQIDKKPKTIKEFFEEVDIQSDKSYLFILNTVNSAKELYSMLKEKYPDEVLLLTTHIIPKDRLNRIKQIKNKEKRIVVSTQLVEAGVDIDFDVVYRDFAPLDSIIQSAGRCNREDKKDKGIVRVVNLCNDNSKPYHSFIYDTVLTESTKKILENNCYSEKDILNLVKKYYEELKERTSEHQSIELLKMLCQLKFSGEKENNKITSIQDFVLIEEDFYKSDVFIEIDDDAKKVWQEYINIWQLKDVFDRKKAFDELKAEFYSYVISVPIKENTPCIEKGFYYVSNTNLKDFYDIEFGYKTKGNAFFEF